MATTTNPVSGSSNGVLSSDRSGENSSANRYSLRFKQADSAVGLFEELLSLPIFDSTIVDSDSPNNNSAVTSTVEFNKTRSSYESPNDRKEEEKPLQDGPISAAVLGAVNVPLVQPQLIVDTKPKPQPRTENLTPIQTHSAPLVESKPVSTKSLESVIAVKAGKRATVEESTLTQKHDSAFQAESEPGKSLAFGSESETTQVTGKVTGQAEPTIAESSDRVDQVVPVAEESKADFKKKKREDKGPVATAVTDVLSDNNENILPSISSDTVSDGSNKVKLPTESVSNEEDDSQPEVEPTNSRRAEYLDDRRRESRFEDDRESGSKAQDQESEPIVDSTTKADATSDSAKGIVSNASYELGSSKTFVDAFGSTGGTSLNTSSLSDAGQSSISSSIAANALSSGSTNAGPSTSANSVQTISSVGVSGTTTSSGGIIFTSSSSSSRGTSGSTGLTKYQEQRVLQRALAGIEQLQDGSSPVRIRLHPPELGSLQVTVKVVNSQVIAAVEVEHTAAKQVLLDNLPKLQASLKEQGITIADFRVEVVPSGEFSGSSTGSFAQQQGQARDGSSSSQSSRYTEIARNRLEQSPVGAASGGTTAVWSRRDGNLDVNV